MTDPLLTNFTSFSKKKSRIRETLNLSTDADHRTNTNLRRLYDLSLFFLLSDIFQINHATSPKLYWSYDPHRSRDSMSPVWGIFYMVYYADNFAAACVGFYFVSYIVKCVFQYVDNIFFWYFSHPSKEIKSENVHKIKLWRNEHILRKGLMKTHIFCSPNPQTTKTSVFCKVNMWLLTKTRPKQSVPNSWS